MSSLKKVVVIGASGNIGQPITKALLDANFQVLAVTREDSTSTFPESVSVVKSDFSQESLTSAFTGQDAVVCAVGYGGFDKQLEIIKAAEAAGIKRFIPSEFGTLSEGRPPAVFEKLSDAKAKTIDYLKQRAAENKSFTWTGVATGAFFDWGLAAELRTGRPGVLRVSLKNRSIEILDSGNVPFCATNVSTIGRAVAAILLKAEETANRFVAIYSVLTTQNELLEALEDVTGEKWKVTRSTSKEVLQKALEAFEQGDRSAFGDILSAGFLEEGTGCGVLKLDGKYDNELLGLEKEDLKTTLKGILAKF